MFNNMYSYHPIIYRYAHGQYYKVWYTGKVSSFIYYDILQGSVTEESWITIDCYKILLKENILWTEKFPL